MGLPMLATPRFGRAEAVRLLVGAPAASEHDARAAANAGSTRRSPGADHNRASIPARSET